MAVEHDPPPQDKPVVDGAALSAASMRTLIDEVGRLLDLAGEHSEELLTLADLIIAEAVGLIRMGERLDVPDASLTVGGFLTSPAAEQLRKQTPFAYGKIVGAFESLRAAATPGSKGSELTVLRSWSGDALRVVDLLNRAAGHALTRSHLRRELLVDDPYLSTLLSELSTAGLAELAPADDGDVHVQLGPRGRAAHVQIMLS